MIPIQGNHMAQAPQMIRQQAFLSNEEFENLKRSIQLLRIEQIRYIVQRFALPASGNKTRLIQIVLGIIDTLRPTPLLVEMNAEVNRLLQTQHEPFANPFESTHKLVPFTDTEQMFVPEHPLYTLTERPPLMGPFYAQTGTNTLLNPVNIIVDDVKSVIMEFSWSSLPPKPFDMVLDVNGSQIIVSSDDPNPQPIDLSDFFKSSQMVRICIRSLKTQTPMTVAIREYCMQNVFSVAKNMAENAGLDAPPELLRCRGKQCTTHPHSGFPLVNFLANCFAAKNICPICGAHIALSDIDIFVEKKLDENWEN
jgi:hypothetical protein